MILSYSVKHPLTHLVEALHHLAVDTKAQDVRTDLVVVCDGVTLHCQTPSGRPYQRHQQVIHIPQTLSGLPHDERRSV